MMKYRVVIKLKYIVYLIPIMVLMAGCTASNNFVKPAGYEIDKYTLPYFTWMDPYYADHGEKRFFDIDSLMSDFSLTRLEAVEVQNRYRDEMYDLYEANDCNELKQELPPDSLPYEIDCVSMALRDNVFLDSINYISKNGGESGWTKGKLNNSKFVVVFDLDETLFRDNVNAKCLDIMECISFAPGWDKAIEGVKNSNGAVVLFTAKPDYKLSVILKNWKISFNGEKVLVSSVVDGVFSNNHLIKIKKSEGSNVVLDESKDLRIIDPSLNKVVIVDDNPKRIIHVRNLRYVRKWLPVKGNDTFGYKDRLHRTYYESRLSTVVAEILDSVKWAESNSKNVVDGFLPYSYMGRQITQEVIGASYVNNCKKCGDWENAVNYIRNHPEIIDAKY